MCRIQWSYGGQRSDRWTVMSHLLFCLIWFQIVSKKTLQSLFWCAHWPLSFVDTNPSSDCSSAPCINVKIHTWVWQHFTFLAHLCIFAFPLSKFSVVSSGIVLTCTRSFCSTRVFTTVVQSIESLWSMNLAQAIQIWFVLELQLWVNRKKAFQWSVGWWFIQFPQHSMSVCEQDTEPQN